MTRQHHEATIAARQRPNLAILWILITVILFATAARVWLGADLLFRPDVVHRIIALTRWRDLDQFSCWFPVLILALADQFSGGRGKKIIPWLLAAGMLILFAATLLSDDHLKAIMELAASCVLALAAAIVSVRQLSGITSLSSAPPAPGAPRGITIEQLWRLFAVQWTLVWVAAEMFLRFKFRAQGVSSEEGARNLLFALPAFGAGPMTLMAVGIRWWTILRPRLPEPIPRPRPRAWLIALFAVNLGAIGIVMGTLPGEGKRWFAVFGALPMLPGLAMYVLGFGRGAWKWGGQPVILGLALFAVGMLMFAGERLNPDTGRGSLWEFTAAWRFLAGTGFTLFWLAGIGSMAMRAWALPRLQAPLALRLSQIALSLGVLGTATIFIIAGNRGHEWLQGILPTIIILMLKR